jgi:hypothetical protein
MSCENGPDGSSIDFVHSSRLPRESCQAGARLANLSQENHKIVVACSRQCPTLTASLHEKSKLSAVLTQILGTVPDEFDSQVLIGKQVVLTLGTVTKDGKERVRLYGVEAAPEGQNVQVPQGGISVTTQPGN